MRLKNQNVNEDGSLMLKIHATEEPEIKEEVKEEVKVEPKKRGRKKKEEE